MSQFQAAREADRNQDSLRQKRVLVVGGSGFIGAHLVSALAACGANVIAASRSARRMSAAVAEWEKVDVADRGAVDLLIAKVRPEVVYNLAAHVGARRSFQDYFPHLETTFGGAVNLAYAVLRQSVPLMIQAGSSEEYGDEPVPFKEDQPLKPISPYSAAKAAATSVLLSGFRSFSLPVIIVRPTVVYGPGQDSAMFIPSLFRHYTTRSTPALSSGEQSRDFLYIDDLIRALIELCGRTDLCGCVFNLSSNREYKLKSVAEKVAAMCHYQGDLGLGRLPYRQPEVMRHRATFDRATEALGWRPEVSLKQGLGCTLDWWQSRGSTS